MSLEDLSGIGMRHCDRMIKGERGNYCPYDGVKLCPYQGKLVINYQANNYKIRKKFYICMKKTK